MTIVLRKTRRNGEVFYQLATWFLDNFYTFSDKTYKTRLDACLAVRRWELNQVVKTETAYD